MKKYLKQILYEGLYAFLHYFSKAEQECVHYVNGSDTLPPPLSHEEEEETFRLLETDFQAARDKLIVHNLSTQTIQNRNITD